MPHANIHIRKDNWETWLALPNKAEFVNGALQDTRGFSEVPVKFIKKAGVISATDLRCPRHHVPYRLCLDRH